MKYFSLSFDVTLLRDLSSSRNPEYNGPESDGRGDSFDGGSSQRECRWGAEDPGGMQSASRYSQRVRPDRAAGKRRYYSRSHIMNQFQNHYLLNMSRWQIHLVAVFELFPMSALLW